MKWFMNFTPEDFKCWNWGSVVTNLFPCAPNEVVHELYTRRFQVLELRFGSYEPVSMSTQWERRQCHRDFKMTSPPAFYLIKMILFQHNVHLRLLKIMPLLKISKLTSSLLKYLPEQATKNFAHLFQCPFQNAPEIYWAVVGWGIYWHNSIYAKIKRKTFNKQDIFIYDMMMLPAQADVPICWASLWTLLFWWRALCSSYFHFIHLHFLPSSSTSISYILLPHHLFQFLVSFPFINSSVPSYSFGLHL